MVMLDDLTYIHQRDVHDALGLALRQINQLESVIALHNQPHFRHIEQIVVAGMGGSALVVEIVRAVAHLAHPLEVVRGYDVPAYVGQHTLFIACSYSGNTEEVLSALQEAVALGAQVAVIAGGGQLLQLAAERDYFYATLPPVGPPHYVLPATLRAILVILEAAGVIMDDVWPSVAQAVQVVRAATTTWGATTPTSHNPAKQLALELIGKPVIIYAGPALYPAAQKWKMSFNRNARQLAWSSMYPEALHHEIAGWTRQPTHKPWAVVELHSPLERREIQKRIDLIDRLLSGHRPQPHIVTPAGDTPLAQLLWAAVFGEVVSIYVALLGRIDPSATELIHSVKYKQGVETYERSTSTNLRPKQF